MSGEIVFQPSESDYIAAIKGHYKRQLTSPRFRARVIILLAIAIAAVVGIWFWDGDWLPGILGVGGGFAGLAIVVGSQWLLLPRRAARLFRQSKSMRRAFTYRWSPDGLGFTTSTTSGQLPWTDLHRWAQDRSTFAFYNNDAMFHFIPRRFLTAAQDADLVSTTTMHGPPRF